MPSVRQWLKRAGEESSGSTSNSPAPNKRNKVEAVKADDEAQASPIERLGDALLLAIFELGVDPIPDEYDFVTVPMSRTDAARRISLVCKRWKKIASPMLWSTVLMAWESRSQATIRQMFSGNCIGHIKWMSVTLPSTARLDRLFDYIGFPNLETLRLSTFGPIAATRRFPSIVTLSLTAPTTLKDIGRFVASNPSSLRRIYVRTLLSEPTDFIPLSQITELAVGNSLNPNRIFAPHLRQLDVGGDLEMETEDGLTMAKMNEVFPRLSELTLRTWPSFIDPILDTLREITVLMIQVGVHPTSLSSECYVCQRRLTIIRDWVKEHDYGLEHLVLCTGGAHPSTSNSVYDDLERQCERINCKMVEFSQYDWPRPFLFWLPRARPVVRRGKTKNALLRLPNDLLARVFSVCLPAVDAGPFDLAKDSKQRDELRRLGSLHPRIRLAIQSAMWHSLRVTSLRQARAVNSALGPMAQRRRLAAHIRTIVIDLDQSNRRTFWNVLYNDDRDEDAESAVDWDDAETDLCGCGETDCEDCSERQRRDGTGEGGRFFWNVNQQPQWQRLDDQPKLSYDDEQLLEHRHRTYDVLLRRELADVLPFAWRARTLIVSDSRILPSDFHLPSLTDLRITHADPFAAPALIARHPELRRIQLGEDVRLTGTILPQTLALQIVKPVRLASLDAPKLVALDLHLMPGVRGPFAVDRNIMPLLRWMILRGQLSVKVNALDLLQWLPARCSRLQVAFGMHSDDFIGLNTPSGDRLCGACAHYLALGDVVESGAMPSGLIVFTRYDRYPSDGSYHVRNRTALDRALRQRVVDETCFAAALDQLCDQDVPEPEEPTWIARCEDMDLSTHFARL